MTGIEKNYQDYLEEHLKIGFTSNFPVSTVLKNLEVQENCLRFSVTVEIKLCRSTVLNCLMLVTERLDISNRLALNGFGSGCCFDEAHTMERAVIEICKQEDLMICQKVCSWPFAKVIVQKNFYK